MRLSDQYRSSWLTECKRLDGVFGRPKCYRPIDAPKSPAEMTDQELLPECECIEDYDFDTERQTRCRPN
jgi:hypothetical protein